MKLILKKGIFLLFIIGLTACSSCNKAEIINKEASTYDAIIGNNKIRVGYISYPPGFIKDPNSGEYSGIFHEVLQKVGENLELEIEYTEEVGWGTMIEALRSKKVDIIGSPVWPIGTRGKYADFTDPIFFSTVRAYVRANDSRFDDNLDIANSEKITIGVLDGELTSTIARTDFPKAQISSLTQSSDVSQLLLDVISEKTDISFAEPAVAYQFMQSNPGKLKEVKNVLPLRVYPNVMMVAKGENKLTTTLNTAIRELINSGFVDRTIDKYTPFPGAFNKTQIPYRQN